MTSDLQSTYFDHALQEPIPVELKLRYETQLIVESQVSRTLGMCRLELPPQSVSD